MKHYTEEELRNHLDAYIKKYFAGDVQKFADYCGVSKSYVYYALNGERSIPNSCMDVMGFEWAKRTAVRARKHKDV